jgi:hypothetical protein
MATLDATVAGALANSYLTVEEADSFATVDIGPGAARWLAASTDDKERALIQATLDVDDRFGANVLWLSTQRLQFPRLVDVSADVPFIPDAIRRTTYKQAMFRLVNAQQLADAESRRARGLISFSDQDGGGTLAPDSTDLRFASDALGILDQFQGQGSSRAIYSVRLTRWP